MSLFAFRPLSGKQKTTKPLPAIALAQARRAGQRPLRLCGELLLIPFPCQKIYADYRQKSKKHEKDCKTNLTIERRREDISL